MIYIDTSVVLAQLLAEDRQPPAGLWDELLVSSRLLQYEVWTRIHGRGLARTHGDHVRDLLSRIAFLEVIPEVVARADHAFPRPVRTLDALHLATADFLRMHGQKIRLAAYDGRMLEAARALRIPTYAL